MVPGMIDADTHVPLRHSEALARAARGRATLRVLRGETHETIPLDESGAVEREAIAWFGRSLSPRPG